VSRRPPTLAALRARVSRTDLAIAEAIAHRLGLARKIGDLKSRSRVPLRDFATEKCVVARWQGRLRHAGVPGARSGALARWLIEESIRVQEAMPGPTRASRGSGYRIGIIGGAGGMGRWLDGFLTDAGHRVRIVDPRADSASPRTLSSVEAAMQQCEIVAFATPIRTTASLMERALACRSEAIVFDVLSVKAPIVPAIQAARREGRAITSAHPMFGPSARTLSGRNLLVVSCGSKKADGAVRGLFAHSALTLSEVPLERHDRLIAESLGLAHAVNLLFLSALATDPLRPAELAAAASTTFHRQSSLAAAVAQEGPELYLDIQSLNPHSRNVYRELRTAMDRLEEIVERQEVGLFRELLGASRAKLDPGPEPMRA
jgi:chorismate mutase / prephenate dehydrogenase